MPETDFVDFDDCVKKNTGLVDDADSYCKNLIAGQSQQAKSNLSEDHSAKWHSCVDQVSAQGGVESPEAVCTAALGPESFESVELRQQIVKVRLFLESQENHEFSNRVDRIEEELKKLLRTRGY